ncbi:MAG TPA: anti-sigma regulatory factor [Methylomirabilota bacterium]|jgi:anti-sigma regulatory factor (Ser/Thr protein kinase)
MAVRRTTRAVPVEEASQVAQARRLSAALAGAVHMDAERAGRLALVVTESGTNLLRHAGGGQILLQTVDGQETPAVEMLALDRGPGMPNVARCLEDGYSTAGGPGTGLGAMRRLSTVFDVYSRPGQGTAILSRVGAPAARARVLVAGVSVAAPGEHECGDAWDAEWRADGVTILVVDGLGHGAGAAAAAATAVEAFRRAKLERPARRLEILHAAMRGTRGGAAGIADIDVGAGRVAFAGIGNVGAMVVHDDRPRFLVSHNGTLGHTARRITDVTAAWPARGLLVMYSDGLGTPRELAAYPGLTERHPSLVAGVLWRDLARGRDDVTVVVAKAAA